jgi:ankyrin repeat protein
LVDNNGQTPLYYCIKGGKVDACELLLRSGVKIASVDKKGVTPISLAKKS